MKFGLLYAPGHLFTGPGIRYGGSRIAAGDYVFRRAPCRRTQARNVLNDLREFVDDPRLSVASHGLFASRNAEPIWSLRTP